MKGKSSVTMVQLVAVGLMLFLTGCESVEKYSLTYRLWDNGDLRKFSEPAPNSNLALFEATTVMVGAAAAVVGFLMWLQCGAPTH